MFFVKYMYLPLDRNSFETQEECEGRCRQQPPQPDTTTTAALRPTEPEVITLWLFLWPYYTSNKEHRRKNLGKRNFSSTVFEYSFLILQYSSSSPWQKNAGRRILCNRAVATSRCSTSTRSEARAHRPTSVLAGTLTAIVLRRNASDTAGPSRDLVSVTWQHWYTLLKSFSSRQSSGLHKKIRNSLSKHFQISLCVNNCKINIHRLSENDIRLTLKK